MAASGVCAVEGCGKEAKKRGWCYMHYTRWQRNGDPMVARRPGNGEPLRYLEEEVLAYAGTDCLVWPFSRDHNGYGKVWLGAKCAIATRVVCERAHGPPPTPKHDAAHACGKGHLGCVTPAHLSWKTKVDNAADQRVHGTVARGDKQGAAKLVADDVREIRRLAGSVSLSDLADRFGICRDHVRLLQRRRSWAWLD